LFALICYQPWRYLSLHVAICIWFWKKKSCSEDFSGSWRGSCQIQELGAKITGAGMGGVLVRFFTQNPGRRWLHLQSLDDLALKIFVCCDRVSLTKTVSYYFSSGNPIAGVAFDQSQNAQKQLKP
jgi:hypothetical protein